MRPLITAHALYTPGVCVGCGWVGGWVGGGGGGQRSDVRCRRHGTANSGASQQRPEQLRQGRRTQLLGGRDGHDLPGRASQLLRLLPEEVAHARGAFAGEGGEAGGRLRYALCCGDPAQWRPGTSGGSGSSARSSHQGLPASRCLCCRPSTPSFAGPRPCRAATASSFRLRLRCSSATRQPAFLEASQSVNLSWRSGAGPAGSVRAATATAAFSAPARAPRGVTSTEVAMPTSRPARHTRDSSWRPLVSLLVSLTLSWRLKRGSGCHSLGHPLERTLHPASSSAHAAAAHLLPHCAWPRGWLRCPPGHQCLQRQHRRRRASAAASVLPPAWRVQQRTLSRASSA
jgi:hypothetical protein